MATSAVKQIILHQYHTFLHDDLHHNNKGTFPKMSSRRLKGSPSIMKISPSSREFTTPSNTIKINLI